MDSNHYLRFVGAILHIITTTPMAGLKGFEPISDPGVGPFYRVSEVLYLLTLNYNPKCKILYQVHESACGQIFTKTAAEPTRFELASSRLTVWCFCQLNYGSIKMCNRSPKYLYLWRTASDLPLVHTHWPPSHLLSGKNVKYKVTKSHIPVSIFKWY